MATMPNVSKKSSYAPMHEMRYMYWISCRTIALLHTETKEVVHSQDSGLLVILTLRNIVEGRSTVTAQGLMNVLPVMCSHVYIANLLATPASFTWFMTDSLLRQVLLPGLYIHSTMNCTGAVKLQETTKSEKIEDKHLTRPVHNRPI